MRHAGGLLLFHCNKCDVINYMMCVFILNAGMLQFVRNYIFKLLFACKTTVKRTDLMVYHHNFSDVYNN